MHHGDARDVPADVAIFGHRCPLRAWTSEHHGAVFESVAAVKAPFPLLPLPVPSPIELAAPATGPWQHVLSIRTRSRGRRGTRPGDALAMALTHAINSWQPSTVLMLPLSWRDAPLVARSMLLGLWTIANAEEFFLETRPWWTTIFTLSTHDDPAPLLDVLKDDADAFYEWLEPRYNTTGYMGRWPDRPRVEFKLVD